LAELKDEYCRAAAADMLNVAFLGLCVAVLGVGIWLVMVLVSDLKGVVRRIR
jgi:hypothetical protein